MKINRTFSIDLSLYTQLTKTSNQSKTVCSALRKYFDQDPSKVLVEDASTLYLVKKLSDRDDIGRTMKTLCEIILKNGL